MSLNSINEVENLVGLYGGWLISIGLVVYFSVKGLFSSYLSEKGKNYATKEDVGLITKAVESVKSDYAALLEEVKAGNQIKILAIEREQSIKKDVYMDAIEAVALSHSTVIKFSNLDCSLEEIASIFSKQAGKAAKVQVVGSKDTVHAFMTFMSEIGTAMFDLSTKRIELDLRKNYIGHLTGVMETHSREIERYVAIMKEINLTGNQDKRSWFHVNETIEFEKKRHASCAEEINGLLEKQRKESLEYSQACFARHLKISDYLPKIILSVRDELGLKIVTEDYLGIHNENTKKADEAFKKFIKEIEQQWK